MVEAALDTPSKSTKPTTIPGSFPISEPDSEPASGPDQISEPRPAGYTLPGEVLVVFTSPVDHYITPNFYTESKAATGKVAPTWNYAAVQVYGRVTIYHDTKDARTEEFLRRQLGDLARLGEVGVMGFQDIDSDSNSDNSQGQESQGGEDAASGSGAGVPMTKTATATATAAEEKEKAAQELSAGNSSNTASPTPWKIADAPLEYIATLLKNIVGMQIHITRIEGRFKVSQERPVNDRSGVVEGLQGMGSVRAKAMAEFVGRGRVLG
jgi:transcriptional regulator